MALTLQGITCTYPSGTVALDDVSLSLAPGIFGLLGPNGAGKSTLLRVIATLQQPDYGSITLDGIDLRAHPSDARARLGYLPQDFGLYPNLSAEATLDYFAALKGFEHEPERRVQVQALLERVHLGAHRRQAVGTFSGGMRQRLGLAIALIGAPRLLILDEPTSGLDPAERHRLYDDLAAIGEQVIVLLSTHLVDDVAALAPTLAVLSKGRIVRQGTCAELMAPLRGRVWRITSNAAVLDEVAQEHRELSRRRAAGRLVARVVAEHAPHNDAEPAEPTLEDAYFDAIGAPAGDDE